MTALRGVVAARPRHAVLAALCAGLLLGAWAPALAVATVATVAAACAPRRAVAAALAFAVLGGAVTAERRVAALAGGPLAASPHGALAADVTLLESARRSPYGGSVPARVRGEPVLLRARGPALDGAAAGDVLRVAGTLRPPGPYARARRAHAEVAVSSAAAGPAPGGPVATVRRIARRALAHGLPATEAALYRGMVLGDDGALPDAARADMRASGLTHLVAASGANIALLAALAVALARAVGLGLTARWVAAIALIVLYVPLAGGGPSILRAGVMGVAGAVAIVVGRPASRGYALLLAAAVTLTLDPRAASDPGWQLSFAAVVALMLTGRRWATRLRERGMPALPADAVAVTVAATLATAPVVALHFGRVSLVALPANVLVAPLVPVVMWLGALAVLAEPVMPGLAALLDAAAAYPLACILAVARVAAGLPGAQLAAGPVPVLLGAGASIAVIEHRALAARLPRRARAPAALAGALVALSGAGLAAAALAMRPHPPGPPPPGRLRLTVLDVGQGDAILAQEGRHAILVDTGPPEGAIVGRLRRAGVRRLDLLVLTHAETDHAGGAAAVLSALPVAAVLDGRDGVDRPVARAAGLAAAARRVRRIRPDAGMVLRVGTMRLRVLWPRAEPAARHAGGNPNDRAVVAELDVGGVRVLLPADAESPVTLPLHLDGPVDVLKVAHHGSADPGLPALLATLRPRIAVISAGRGNPFGHPAPQALAALRAVPIVLRTDRGGTVRLDRGAGGWEIRRGP